METVKPNHQGWCPPAGPKETRHRKKYTLPLLSSEGSNVKQMWEGTKHLESRIVEAEQEACHCWGLSTNPSSKGEANKETDTSGRLLEPDILYTSLTQAVWVNLCLSYDVCTLWIASEASLQTERWGKHGTHGKWGGKDMYHQWPLTKNSGKAWSGWSLSRNLGGKRSLEIIIQQKSCF